MRQKSVPEKEPATQVVKIRRATRQHLSAEERSALYWKACAARTVSPSSAAARGSSRTFITAGRKTFLRRGRATGWRYGPGRDVGRGQEPASRDRRLQHQRRAA